MWEIEDSIAEQEELEIKKQQFESVCNGLATTELQFIDLEKLLHNFEIKYYRHVGKYHIELQELKTKLARWRYQLNPLDKKLQELVDNYFIQLETAYEKLNLSQIDNAEKTIIEDRTLITVFTKSLSTIHPVRAYDLSNKAKRELWYNRLIDAFEKQSLDEVLEIDKTFKISLDAVEDGDVSTLLISTIRKIYRAKMEIKQIDNRIILLRKTDFYQMIEKLKREDEETFFQNIINEFLFHTNQIIAVLTHRDIVTKFK